MWVVRAREGERRRERGEERSGESGIIGATSKTREPRGYPRGNVIGSWARGGPFGVVFWVQRVGEGRGGRGGEGGGETTGSQSFRGRMCAGAALSRPKARPPKPRGAYFTNDRSPRSTTPRSHRTRTSSSTHARARARARFHSLSRCVAGEKETPREAYLSATSSGGPAGEMKLDHLYWVCAFLPGWR